MFRLGVLLAPLLAVAALSWVATAPSFAADGEDGGSPPVPAADALTVGRVLVPAVSRGIPEVPPEADVVSLAVPAAGVSASTVVEPAGTVLVNGEEYFATPSHPARIAWYADFGEPGRGGSNSLMSAHVNYFGYGAATPFANLHLAGPGDTLRVGLSDGRVLTFTITSSTIYLESVLAAMMSEVVYPPLPADRERVTLITCAGDFIPTTPGGAGVYNSRLIVVAERVLD